MNKPTTETETEITPEDYHLYIRFLVESSCSIAEIPNVEFSIKKSDGTTQKLNLAECVDNVRKNGNVLASIFTIMMDKDLKSIVGTWVRNQKKINKIMEGWEKLAD